MRVGILALQGAFIEHEQIMSKLGVSTFEIRQAKDIETEFDGLIIPGGESTVQGKLLRELDLFGPIKQKIIDGLPVFGTCAGLILLAKQIGNDERTHFALMDIKVVRNAYGRQLGSFQAKENFDGIGKIPMIFIRAPYIERVYGDAEALASVNGKVVAARQRNMLVTAFHPELTDDTRVHDYFINMIKSHNMAGENYA